MAGFNIVFETAADPYVLEWKINQNPLSIEWLHKLEYVSKNKKIDDARRFYGMPQSTTAEVYQAMDLAIKKLNTLGHNLPEVIQEKYDQSWLNFLHDYFAENHGRDHEIKSQTLSQELIDCWNQLHINLHRYEALLEGNPEPKRITATWREQGETMSVYKLADYDKFSWTSNFGDVFINYREVGRSAFDVYLSKDKIDRDVLVNSVHWCADLRIHFFDMQEQDFIGNYWLWYQQNVQWFRDQFGFSDQDSRVNPGFYPVAQLVTSDTKESIIKNISESKKIQSINIGW